jgi:hypothetical protein
MYGQINTGGHGQPQHGQQSWNTMPPPQMQNPPNSTSPYQGSNQGGGGGGGGGGSESLLVFFRYRVGNLIQGTVKGIIKGLKGLVSQKQQQPPQQYPGTANPPYMQQVSGPISPNHPGVHHGRPSHT